LPEYFVRTFARNPAESGALAGLVLTLGSAIGIGPEVFLAVWLRRRSHEGANLAVVIASYVTPVTLLILLPFVASPTGAALLFGAAFLLFKPSRRPQIDLIQGVVPNELRGRS